MRYEKLSNDELNKYPYPNLMAEIIESGYSICTVAEHMGLPRRRQQYDAEVWGKLKGDVDILASEAIWLSHLYNVKMEYLFDDKLQVMCGMSLAYWRWRGWNEKIKREESQRQLVRKIQNTLMNRPELIQLFKELITLDADQLQEFKLLFMEKTSNNRIQK